MPLLHANQRTHHSLLKADELKEKILNSDDSVNLLLRSQVERMYERVLLTDLSLAIAKRCEQNLWTFCVRNCVESYQRKKEKSRTSEDSASLQLFLQAASGFFIQLLTKLAVAYRLEEIPGAKSATSLGILSDHFCTTNRQDVPQHTVKYIVQFCLVHLGDLARYQKLVAPAESYYLHAISVSPENGHAYNQLSITSMQRGDKLGAVYFYSRAIHVAQPFQLASTNLEKFYTAVVQSSKTAQPRRTTTAASYIHNFILLHASVHLASDLSDLFTLVDELGAELTPSLETHSVNDTQLLRMFSISFAAIYRLFTEKNDEFSQLVATLSDTERHSLELLCSLIVLQLTSLFRFFVQTSEHRRVDFLPVVHVVLCWLRSNEHVFRLVTSAALGDFFAALAEFLNVLQVISEAKKGLKDEEPLPCEVELASFLPLKDAFTAVNFGGCKKQVDDEQILLRTNVVRILNFAKWIAATTDAAEIFRYEPTEGSSRLKFFALPTATVGKKAPTAGAAANSVAPLAKKVVGGTTNGGSVLVEPIKPLTTAGAHHRVQFKAGPPDERALPSVVEEESDEAPPAISLLKKPSKLVAMKTILEGKAIASPPHTEAATPEPARDEPVKQSSDFEREMPPRFVKAAKLKLALSGRAQTPPGAPMYAQQVHLTRLVDEKGRELKMEEHPLYDNARNFQQKREPPVDAGGFERFPMPPPMPGADFARTPGARPPGMPPFPLPPPFMPPPGLPVPPGLQAASLAGRRDSNEPSTPLGSVNFRPNDPFFQVWQQQSGSDRGPSGIAGWSTANEQTRASTQQQSAPVFSSAPGGFPNFAPRMPPQQDPAHRLPPQLPFGGANSGGYSLFNSPWPWNTPGAPPPPFQPWNNPPPEGKK